LWKSGQVVRPLHVKNNVAYGTSFNRRVVFFGRLAPEIGWLALPIAGSVGEANTPVLQFLQSMSADTLAFQYTQY
jgi:hypothetical protein